MPARRAPSTAPRQYELSELPTLGWVTVTDAGEENLYFTLADGSRGFAKYHG